MKKMNHSKHNTEKGLEDLPSCGKTLYASALVTVNEKGYTKHYFEEGKRICSKIGSGELQNVNQLVDHMEMDYEEQRSIQTEGVTNTYEGCMDISPYIKNGNLYETIIKKYTTQVNSSEPAFYYHSDHLGSASYITGSSGIQTQQLVYLPFGEDWVDKKYNSPQYETPFKFNGKEKDEETGYNYYGARYYYDWTSIWLSVDPLSDKYPHLTSYNYCANNPIMLVDPDGRDNVIYLVNLQGKDQKVNANKLIAETNKRFKSLGLNTRMELAPDGRDFDPQYMDNTDSYAVLGSADDVKGFIKSKDQYAYDKHFKDWPGGYDNPERSTNSCGEVTKTIGIDANNLGETSKAFGVSKETMGAFLVLHGAGHNAYLNHSDEPNAREPQTMGNAAIMGSGNIMYGRDINNFMKKSVNSHYNDAMKTYFGNNPARATYRYNKNTSKPRNY